MKAEFEVNGITIEVYKRAVVDPEKDREIVINRLANPGFILLSHTVYVRTLPLRDILTVLDYDSTTFDTAVPENWFEEYMKFFGCRPNVVWYYPKRSIFGKPLPYSIVIEQFCEKISMMLLEGKYEFV